MSTARLQAHHLIDRMPETQLSGLVQFLETIVDPLSAALRDAPEEDEEISAEEEAAVARSREYFRNGGKGIPFEQVVEELGFTMDQVRNHRINE